jgi:hypothetical protein
MNCRKKTGSYQRRFPGTGRAYNRYEMVLLQFPEKVMYMTLPSKEQMMLLVIEGP